VRIDGTAAGAGVNGLTLVGNTRTAIYGLEITNFSGSGIVISGGSKNRVSDCKISDNGVHGVLIENSTGNLLGQEYYADVDNIVSGNGTSV
jgi:parallel beta-helix repeat protein